MVDDQALDWVIRTRDPEFADWEGLTAWLEAAPDNAAAYDMLMAADADLPALLPSDPVIVPTPANDRADRPGRPGWRSLRWFGGGAIAAALVGAIALGVTARSDIYSVTTRPGETRTIALDDGTRVDLNGGTTMRFDRNDARFAALDKGEAAFTVRHDADNPFRVTVGETVFEDAGTVFNIVHTGDATRIGVSEGLVIYNPEAEAISLPAGRALSEDGSGLRVTEVSHDAVASWRGGRLVYAGAPVAQISQDISRSIGVEIRTTPGAASTRFTGTIMLTRDPARFFASAAPLMGLSAVRQGSGWLLKEADGPSG
ncbi:MAG: FecR domain-containing protein [Sphingobium sp.]